MGTVVQPGRPRAVEDSEEQGALVRFVGDTRQHVAVEAGDFGRTLEQHSNLRSVSIGKISRQRDPEYRAAVMEMASSKRVFFSNLTGEPLQYLIRSHL